MQKRTKLQQQLLVASCAGLLVASTGCRSAMPKWNMFGGKAPSAETLAGAGPTITYPAPPSEAATPDAIASVAGGTAESIDPSAIVTSSPQTIAPVSGFDTSREDLASATTNNAAARANGFNLASNRTPSSEAGGLPGYAAPSPEQPKNNSAVPMVPAGYQFGTKKSAPGTASPSGSSYVMPSAYPAPGAAPAVEGTGSSYGLPSASAPIIPTTASQTTTPGFGMPAGGIPAPATTGGSGGFAMPTSMAPSVNAPASSAVNHPTSSATNAQPFTPKTPTTMASATMAPPEGMNLPSNSAHSTPASTASTGASAPSFSTASAALAPRSSDSSKSSGYAPGSTSGSGSYPTTSGYPSTGTDGSFYR